MEVEWQSLLFKMGKVLVEVRSTLISLFLYCSSQKNHNSLLKHAIFVNRLNWDFTIKDLKIKGI